MSTDAALRSLRPPRLGYVLTHHPRASQTFIDAELDALAAAGTAVTVFAMNEPGADQLRTESARIQQAATVYLKSGGVPSALRAVGSAVRRAPRALAATAWVALRSSPPRPSVLARRGAHLAEAVIVWDSARRRHITTLHAHFAQAPSTIAWLATEIGRRSGVGPSRFAVTIHGIGEMASPEVDLPPAKVGSATIVRFVCQAALDHFAALDRRAETKVLRCGIDLEEFTFRQPRPVGIPPRVAIVGRLSVAKGQRDAIDAVAQLRRDGTDVELMLIGAGDDEGALRARAVSHGIGDAVVFTGELARAEVRDALEQSDVLCLPSYDEGLPIAVMEALAVGCPVVATAIAGIPELVVDHQSGRLVQPGDVAALAEALHQALTDEPARTRWTSAGRSAVTERHDQRRTLPDLIEMLAGVDRGAVGTVTGAVR